MFVSQLSFFSFVSKTSISQFNNTCLVYIFVPAYSSIFRYFIIISKSLYSYYKFCKWKSCSGVSIRPTSIIVEFITADRNNLSSVHTLILISEGELRFGNLILPVCWQRFSSTKNLKHFLMKFCFLQRLIFPQLAEDKMTKIRKINQSISKMKINEKILSKILIITLQCSLIYQRFPKK